MHLLFCISCAYVSLLYSILMLRGVSNGDGFGSRGYVVSCIARNNSVCDLFIVNCFYPGSDTMLLTGKSVLQHLKTTTITTFWRQNTMTQCTNNEYVYAKYLSFSLRQSQVSWLKLFARMQIASVMILNVEYDIFRGDRASKVCRVSKTLHLRWCINWSLNKINSMHFEW